MKLSASFRKQLPRKTICAALALTVVWIAGCAANAETIGTPETAPRSEVYTVQNGTVTKSIAMLGNIEYEQTAVLKWKTGGVVSAVNVSVGDAVKKGDVLAELAPDSLSSAVLGAEKELIDAMSAAANVMVSEVKKYQALATLAVDEITLKATKAAQEKLYYPRGTTQDLQMAYDSLALAEKNFNYAKEDLRAVLDSYKSWGEDETRSTYFEAYKQNYDTLQSAYGKWRYLRRAPEAVDLAFAQGAVANAQRAYDEILREYESYRVIPRAKDRKSAESAVELAETTFEQRYIIAPFDGTIGSVAAEANQAVSLGTEAFSLVDLSAYYLEVMVNEVDREKMTLNQAVAVEIDVLPDQKFSGTIIKIDNAATGTDQGAQIAALIRLNETDSRIKAGMTASVEFPIVTRSDVPVVPIGAIMTKDGVRTVERITADGTETVEIRVGLINALCAEVAGGDLALGDRLSVSSMDERFYESCGIEKAAEAGAE